MPGRPTDEQLRERLTDEQWQVTQEAGTERAFTGEYWDTKESGVYRCRVCDEPLFTSDTKFESGTGWPSFTDPIAETAVDSKKDIGFGMIRIESLCANCGAHLGHVFPDGPGLSGKRYCMNSASLRLETEDTNADDGEVTDQA